MGKQDEPEPRVGKGLAWERSSYEQKPECPGALDRWIQSSRSRVWMKSHDRLDCEESSRTPRSSHCLALRPFDSDRDW